MPSLTSPRTKYLGTLAGLRAYLVNGRIVRDTIDIDFTMGGNAGVYKYVPRNEIWIDDATGPIDRCATALHELVERDLMISLGLDYDRAHDLANVAERPFRAELARKPPRTFDGRRVAVAYQRWRGRRDAPA